MFSGPRIPAQRKKGLVAPHLCFLPHLRIDKGRAQHKVENGSKIWAPRDCRSTGITVFHKHRPPIRTSGKEATSPHGWRVLERGCPSDQRVLSFLFQGNIQCLKSSVLTKHSRNKKTQKPKNGNDQATKTWHFLIFSPESFT